MSGSSEPQEPWASARASAELPVPQRQSASAVLMIRPKHFGRNDETAASNRFQSRQTERAGELVADAAVREFDALHAALREPGVAVHVIAGQDAFACPDEIFPNNWLGTHGDGTAVLYPMMAPSRRRERRIDVLDRLRDAGYDIRRIVDLSDLEQRGLFLEGTGSLVLDRVTRVAYACRSARTSPDAVRAFGKRLDFDAVIFDARDRDGHPIYHTNVLMSVGSTFAVVCTEAIPDSAQRRLVVDRLAAGGKQVVEIGYDALHAFAGNLLALRGNTPIIALSQRALDALEPAQRDALAEHGRLVNVSVDTIETYGGGSVRCMLAEVFLPRNA